jgi:hypothetical protein
LRIAESSDYRRDAFFLDKFLIFPYLYTPFWQEPGLALGTRIYSILYRARRLRKDISGIIATYDSIRKIKIFQKFGYFSSPFVS